MSDVTLVNLFGDKLKPRNSDNRRLGDTLVLQPMRISLQFTVLFSLHFLLFSFLPMPCDRVGRRGMVLGSVCLFVCLSVWPQHNSETNDPKVFKLGVGN